MPVFLSAAWIQALQDAARGIETDAPVRIEQRVTHGPAGEIRYRVAVGCPTDGPPDLTFELPYATAVALARGDEAPQDALQRGDLRVGGDLRRLPDAGAVAGAMAAVRAQTTFPDGIGPRPA